MASSASESKRLPALARIWDAPVEPLDVESSRQGPTPCFSRCPTRSPQSWRRSSSTRHAGLRSVGCVSVARCGAASAVVSAFSDRSIPAAYGLTERRRPELASARLVACPGCYPTAAVLALQPLVAAALLEPGIIIDAKSGISGAGKTPTERTHFSECHGSISAYGVFAHRHAAEIEQEIGTPVTFVPHLVPLDRGILETIYARLRPGMDESAVAAASTHAYAASPFVRLTGGDLPEIKHVAYTNFCDIGWRVRASSS